MGSNFGFKKSLGSNYSSVGIQQKFRTLEVGVGSFRWRNQKRKEKGLQENPYLYLLRGETLGMCWVSTPPSRRSKPGGDERRTRALGRLAVFHIGKVHKESSAGYEKHGWAIWFINFKELSNELSD